jgi:hypothetical protein
MDRCLKLDNARLDLAPSSPHRALVLLDHIDTGDDNALLLGQDTFDRATKPSIVPGDDLHRIACLNSVHRNTS